MNRIAIQGLLCLLLTSPAFSQQLSSPFSARIVQTFKMLADTADVEKPEVVGAALDTKINLRRSEKIGNVQCWGGGEAGKTPEMYADIYDPAPDAPFGPVIYASDEPKSGSRGRMDAPRVIVKTELMYLYNHGLVCRRNAMGMLQSRLVTLSLSPLQRIACITKAATLQAMPGSRENGIGGVSYRSGRTDGLGSVVDIGAFDNDGCASHIVLRQGHVEDQ